MTTLEEPRPYIIYRPPPGWGFWSNFSCVLQGLDHADRFGLMPVIDMERNPTRYNEDGPVNGVINAWEYYFHQPGGLTLAEALALNPLSNGGDVSGAFTCLRPPVIPSPDLLAKGRGLVRKYIRPKSDVLAKLDAVISADDGKGMLGVHVRGTDMRQHRPPYHPAPNTPGTYLEQAKRLDEEYSYSRIFLACDEQETVALFREHFKDRLLNLPAHRTAVDQVEIPREVSYKWLFEGDRQHHRYLLGLEVLLDALLLSRCGHLACGASNVSRGAMYFASDSQIVHPVTPLWMCPGRDKPSVGRFYLAETPPLSRKPSAMVLEEQIHEFHDLLEYTENDRAKVCQCLEDKNRDLIRANEELEKLRREKSCLSSRVEALRHELKEQKATIEMLKGRISALINRWTRLGWNLMPWMKPPWRSHPHK